MEPNTRNKVKSESELYRNALGWACVMWGCVIATGVTLTSHGKTLLGIVTGGAFGLAGVASGFATYKAVSKAIYAAERKEDERLSQRVAEIVEEKFRVQTLKESDLLSNQDRTIQDTFRKWEVSLSKQPTNSARLGR